MCEWEEKGSFTKKARKNTGLQHNGMLNIGLGRIVPNSEHDSFYTVYFFVLTQKSNKKSQGC